MKKRKQNPNRIKTSKLLFVISFFLFGLICFQLTKLSISETVNGIDLRRFANNRNTQKEVLTAMRGTIYNANGDPLAQTVNSYTVIAYLDERRSEGFNNPQHVVDKQITAEHLAPLLNMSEERIYNLLNRPNLYQVELGPGGKNITELTKEAIEKLRLPGIGFIKSYKRYYPNHDFLSYTLGYVQKYDEKLVGEMGIELYYDEYLRGIDGSLEYQKDLNGFRIPNTPELRKDEIDGVDIYLTIDNNIQMFVERAVKNTASTYSPEWMLMIAADAKTGKILGTTSTPSFNPNTRNIKSYLNPLVSHAFEPGSTMKIFTYMAAMEKQTYNGEEIFLSGNKKIGDYTITDWNRKGWGQINYDRGFTVSSNVGVSYLMDNYITKNDLKSYLALAGFGQKTNITLPGEVNGKIDFNYSIEIANAAFGQGITITPIQMIQALTAVSNNGIMLKPYIVDKIVDPNNEEIILQNEKEEIGKIAMEETVKAIKELMYDVIHLPFELATGAGYKIEGYDIIGKTGTAQYVNPTTGKYQRGENDYIRSFAGMFPKEDPEIIIYTIVKKASHGGSQAVVTSTKKLIEDIAKYLNMFPEVDSDNEYQLYEYKMPNLTNKKKDDAVELFSDYKNNIVVIGDGHKIINQFPTPNLNVNCKDKLFLVTNDKDIYLPSFANWSYRDVKTYCNLTNLNCEINGFGYVTWQNIPVDTLVNPDDIVEISLNNWYN